ncbi:MAG: Ig-like domain-containing protein, partial [Propionibacteriaceae bacterium]|nr:Ig-like domain-containing protein [Propionibacteriaceae bacterium]
TFVTEAGPAIADGVQTRYAKVRIVNANGVPIPGLAVVFTVPAGTSSGTTVGGDGVIVVARTDADGWAMVTYTSTVAGDYQVSASIKTPYTYPDDQQAFDPAHVLGTGTIQFVPGPADATKSTITITPSAVKPGVEATITITLRDAQGNLLGDNNEQIALSVVTGDGLLTADNVVISELVNNHDGTWTAKISGLVEGATAATFSIGGKPSGQQAPLTILPADEAIVDMIAPDRIDLTTMMNESIDFSVLDKVKTTAQPVTFVSIEDGDHGTVEFVAGSATLARNLPEGSVGTLTYTPDEDYVGKDGLTVVVENAQGTQRTIPVYITVKAPKVVVKTGGEAIAATAPWIAGGIGLLGVLVIILAVLSRRRARSEEDSMV